MKEILDIYVEQGYPYEFELDFNTADGLDLEGDYNCYFYNETIGSKTFSSNGELYSLILSETDTDKLTTNLQEYVVHVVNSSTSQKDKLLSGRIVVDKKTRI